MLIVDDEPFAVRAVVQGLDWEALGFGKVFSALDADEAMEKLQSERIDLMICDIEMPGMNGLELVEWATDHYPAVETIFLTGHADFSFAQQAIGLGSFDYLLKPVKRDKLAEVVAKAVDKIKRQEEAREFYTQYRSYVKLWEAHKPVLVERFWQDVLAERFVPTEANLRESLSAANMAVEPDTPVLPILLSVDRWHKEFDERDEEIMEYALRNAASEFLYPGLQSDIVRDRRGLNVALLYAGDAAAFPRREALAVACRDYIAACERYFYCTLSCYIGEAAPIDRLAAQCHSLIEIEHDNVAAAGTVIVAELRREAEAHAAGGAGKEARKKMALPADRDDWVVLFESGRKDELLRRLETMLAALQREKADAEALEGAYHFVLHLLYHVAHKHGLSVKELMGGKKRPDDITAAKSISQLRAWATRLIAAACDALEQQERQGSAVVEKVKRYIDDHLQTVTREELAAHVYLNPAYLSRLFKKETGQSLVDYIIHSKINRAKLLLTESNRKISDIGESLGYDNFSHFGKTFKKSVGLTPQQYRKRFQGLGESQ
ncbi:response regulator [Gordoniibacillus kamchatkensis]|uniref:response regulator n=1 Tax=Gordoniibacillus kamchatkensis TaxID=1590651 RepID=UPI0018CF5195|nr:response regulator [Paenibacillus sp. VKM B-2647]